jgi:hypothetical protein
VLVLAAVDPVAAIIALAALIVSSATLYLTALRRADIEFDHIASASEAELTGFATGGGSLISWPTMRMVHVCLFVSNGGTSSGVIESLKLEDLEVVGDGADGLWTVIESQVVNSSRDPHVIGKALPRGAEPGDADTLWIHVRLPAAGGNADEYARRLAGLTAIRFTARWRYARTRGPHWSLVPERWRPPRREVVEGAAPVEISMDRFRSSVISHWETTGGDHHRRLARIAKGED